MITAFGALLLAACSSNPQPAATTPQPAPTTAPPAATTPAAAPAAPTTEARDVSGTWDFSVDAGGQVVPGEITLTRGTSGYSGRVVPQGMDAADISNVRIAGDRVTFSAATPQGDAIFEATLTADGRSMAGTVQFNGQALPFNARRR